MTAKPRRKRKRSIVTGYAEGIHASVLESYKKAVKRVVGRKSGIYALTKGTKLYYVGIASSLPSRLARHLKDRHRRKWNRFSFYRIGRKRILRDIESILIRVSQPEGNKQRGRFGGRNKNLRKRLMNEIVDNLKKDF